jgi:D-alanyl-lipoteichoic acid acyltransferase DltB (MBOAT superfamily)
MYVIPGKYQWIWLLICSIFFYYTLVPVYLIVFLVLVVLNYGFGLLIDRSETKRNFIFIIGVFVNIGVLGFFKYFGILQSLASEIQGLSEYDSLLRIFLPLGLSFFIFTTLSYLIELKRGTITPERHFGIFAVSLLFFPKILQGPVEKPGSLFNQFRETKHFNYELASEGLKLILWGYFKKLVIADRLAIYVDQVYGSPENHSGFSLLVATIFYSFQIYADLSGYADIAVGSAKVLGFNLTNNFNRPYFATSIKEFWNRWHISLTVWLKDYIFLPLTGYFTDKMKKTRYLGLASEKWVFIVATIITFLIYGIWHGANLNYIVWSMLLGFYLITANLTFSLKEKLRVKAGMTMKRTFYRFSGAFITFILITFTWIFFRTDNCFDALRIIKSIINLGGPLFLDKTSIIYSLAGLSFLIYIEIKREFWQTTNRLHKRHAWFLEHLQYAVLVITILVMGVFNGGPFIYLQF